MAARRVLGVRWAVLVLAIPLLQLAGLQPVAAAPDVGVVPATVTSLGNLRCPDDCIALGHDDEGHDYFMSGSDGGRTWTVETVPGSTGLDTYVLDMECSSASLCYAWGATSRPTLWWTTTPGRGGWRAQVLPIDTHDVETMTCATATSCVAMTTTGSDVMDSAGQAWWTADIAGGVWSMQPVPAAYRVFDITCPTASMCLARGQGNSLSGTGRATMTIWSTADVAAGGWGRIEPRAGNADGVNSIKSLQCFGPAMCVANGVGLSSSGLLDSFSSGYWIATSPTSPDAEDWVWHTGVGSPFERGPLSCASPTICLSWDGAQTMSTDPDVQDFTAGTPLALPMENWGNLQEFGCFSVDQCFAWGSDSGQASAGPLMRTRLWRGSSLGGTWSVAPLPDAAGHADRIPEAELSCSPTACTAVGGLVDAGLGWDSLGPVVWRTGPDGAWRMVAASAEVYPELATTDAAAQVRSTVSLRRKPASGLPTKLVGRVTAARGCDRDRTVTLVGRKGREVKQTRTDRRGRFTIRLTRGVRARLATTARVTVSRKARTQVVCLAARSPKVRVR